MGGMTLVGRGGRARMGGGGPGGRRTAAMSSMYALGGGSDIKGGGLRIAVSPPEGDGAMLT
jgi:hypothetical protein